MENNTDWFIIQIEGKKSLFFTKDKTKKIKLKQNFFLKAQDILDLEQGKKYVCNKDGTIVKKENEIQKNNFLKKEFKTKYAKEKYIRKKEQKRHCIFSVYRITPYTLTEFYLSKKKYFGIETLSYILWTAAICANRKYLVCEEGCLISGSILFKTNGQCIILCAVIEKKTPKTETMFKRKNKEMLSFKNMFLEKDKIFEEKIDKIFDSLIICITSQRPLLEIFIRLSQFVLSSGILVIYSEYKEKLHDIFIHCKKSQEYINIFITECTLKKYEPKKEITHPEIHSNRYNGYILSCTKI